MTIDVARMLDDAKHWRDRATATASESSWYSISNAATGDQATIRIYDEISFWGVDAQAFANDLDNIDASEIVVCVNSPGGSVFDGLAIFNALRNHPARIVTRVDGLAASAASFIVQAGDERVMSGSSQMMIHEAWGVGVGNASEHREFADFLEQQTLNIAGLYADRSETYDAAHYLALMGAETWLSADEAVEVGLADRVLRPERSDDGNDNLAADAANNKISTDAPDTSPDANASGDSPAADVVRAARSEMARAASSLI